MVQKSKVKAQLKAKPKQSATQFKNELDAFRAASTAVLAQIGNLSNNSVVPEKLYHYTSGEGLRGVMRSGTLWLSDIYSMNDPSEFRYAIDKGLEKIRNSSTRLVPGRSVTISQDMVRHFNANVQSLAHFLACSFSCTKDDIGQWRSYADDGKGYALVFDGPMLEKAFLNTASQCAPASPETLYIQYSVAKLTKSLDKLFSLGKQLLSKIDPKAADPVLDSRTQTIVLDMLHNVASASPLFKHPAYDSEEEFRFLYIYPAGAQLPKTFRDRPNSLIRYVTFDWRKLAAPALKEIIIGPAAEPRQAARFIDDLLRAYSTHGPVLITQSEIPYRS